MNCSCANATSATVPASSATTKLVKVARFKSFFLFEGGARRTDRCLLTTLELIASRRPA